MMETVPVSRVVHELRSLADAIEEGKVDALQISKTIIKMESGHHEDCPGVTVAVDTRCRSWVIQFQMREGEIPIGD